METEIWKSIIKLGGEYSVSNFGRIKNNKTGRILKTSKFKNENYIRITIKYKDKPNHFYIHRLVLETFNPIDEPHLYDAHHKDFNRENNNIENLQWLFSIQNKKIKNTKSFELFSNLLLKIGDDELFKRLSEIE